MNDYKCVYVKNKLLTPEEWEFAQSRLHLLDTFLHSEDGQSLISCGKSLTRQVYSVDCGSWITERSAFIHAVYFYLGRLGTGVTIN